MTALLAADELTFRFYMDRIRTRYAFSRPDNSPQPVTAAGARTPVASWVPVRRSHFLVGNRKVIEAVLQTAEGAAFATATEQRRSFKGAWTVHAGALGYSVARTHLEDLGNTWEIVADPLGPGTPALRMVSHSRSARDRDYRVLVDGQESDATISSVYGKPWTWTLQGLQSLAEPARSGLIAAAFLVLPHPTHGGQISTVRNVSY